MDILSPAIIGILGSLLTELFKLLPFLSASPIRKAITAIVVTFGTAVGYTYSVGGALTLELVIASLVFALVSYKSVIEPVKNS